MIVSSLFFFLVVLSKRKRSFFCDKIKKNTNKKMKAELLVQSMEKLEITLEFLLKAPADFENRRVVFKQYLKENKIVLINASGRIYYSNLTNLKQALQALDLPLPTNKEFGGLLNQTPPRKRSKVESSVETAKTN